MKEKKKRGSCGTILIVLIVFLVIGMIMPSKSKESPSETQPSSPTAEVSVETSETNQDPRDLLKEKYGFGDIETIDDDVTGNWRLIRYSSSAPVDEFVFDYYKNFFESDDEIHILINDQLNTTTTLRCTLDNYLLTYEVHEHVEGEEKSAKSLGDGPILGSYMAYVGTGEIEELHPEEDELTEEQQSLLDEAKSAFEEAPVSDKTASQMQAERMALQYLDYTAFSASGLVEQLVYEGFDQGEAEEAVNSLEIDWKEQATKMANNYLVTYAFSASGLAEQLVYEGFDESIASEVVGTLDVDWKEQAVRMGKDYLDYSAFSQSSLKDQLIYEGFSDEEATYGAAECFK